MNIIAQLKIGDMIKIRRNPKPINVKVIFIHPLNLFVSIQSKNYPEAIWPENIIAIINEH